MSDYSKTTDFAAKDALASGNPNKIIKGTDIDTEFNSLATTSATKANKVTSPTAGNLLSMDSTGDLQDASIASSNVVTLTGTQTLTNKTLTAPAMTSPAISSGNLAVANGIGLSSTAGASIKTDSGGTSWLATAGNDSAWGMIVEGNSATQSNAIFAVVKYNGQPALFEVNPDGTATISGSLENTPVGTATPAAGSFTTGAFSGAVSSTKAAASGYTRVTPNYCKRDNGNTSTGLATGSTAVAAPSADAKAVEVEVEVYAGSQNAVGSRYSFVKGYTDAGLTLIQGRVHIQIYEVTAISGVILGGATGTILINLSSPGASLYLDFAHSPGSTAIYRVVGYYD